MYGRGHSQQVQISILFASFKAQAYSMGEMIRQIRTLVNWFPRSRPLERFAMVGALFLSGVELRRWRMGCFLPWVGIIRFII